MLLYINMKNYKNMVCTDFMNVNIALSSYEKLEFYTRVDKKDVSFVALEILKSEALTYDPYHNHTGASCTTYRTFLSDFSLKQ